MRRAATTLLTLAAAWGATASAHATTSVATYDVPHAGVATCLRDAGAGRFGLLGPLGRSTTAIDVLQLRPAGLAPANTTRLGWLTTCPALSGVGDVVTMGGPAVAAHPSFEIWPRQIRVANAGATPQTLSRAASSVIVDPTVATNASGAAVMAWLEGPGLSDGGGSFGPLRLLAAVRPAGSARFGAPVVVASGLSQFVSSVAAGVDATGRATLVWVDTKVDQIDGPVAVATSDANGALRVSQRIDAGRVVDFALAVNPDGRALLATAGGPPAVYERAAGEEQFRALPAPSGAEDLAPSWVSVALGPAGEAALATFSDTGRVTVATRPADGAFGPVHRLTDPPEPDNANLGSSLTLTRSAGSRPSPPRDEDPAGRVSVAIRGDQVAVAWTDAGSRTDALRARAAFGSVSGGVGLPTTLGNPCRTADSVRAVVLPDGRVAVAWADNADVATELWNDFPLGGGRLTVVTDGPPAPAAPAPPNAQVTLASRRPLHIGDPLVLRVRCPQGPCDIRVVGRPRLVLPRGSAQGEGSVSARSQALGTREATMRLFAGPPQTFATPDARTRQRLEVTTCAVDGASSSTQTVPVTLRGAPRRPMPRIVSATAHRHGGRVVVSIRTDGPIEGGVNAMGRPFNGDFPATAAVPGRGRRHVTFSLLAPAGDRIRRVDVVIVNRDGQASPSRRIRVR